MLEWGICHRTPLQKSHRPEDRNSRYNTRVFNGQNDSSARYNTPVFNGQSDSSARFNTPVFNGQSDSSARYNTPVFNGQREGFECQVQYTCIQWTEWLECQVKYRCNTPLCRGWGDQTAGHNTLVYECQGSIHLYTARMTRLPGLIHLYIGAKLWV